MNYYTINEAAARTAHDANHMRPYVEGSQTAAYQRHVDRAYSIGETRKQRYPECAERIDYLCDKYAKELAMWYNESFRVEAMCPSVIISGAGNFPVHKKEKQNSRRDALHYKRESINRILDRIESCGSDAIMSGDAQAVEKIRLKIERLTDEQEFMKAVNAYYRKHKTLEGCPELTPEQVEEIRADMERGFNLEGKPYPSWALSNNNASIRRYKERLKDLEAIKEQGTQERSSEEVGVEGVTVVENTEVMRIQLIFDGKPDEETRTLLKRNGFRWSPRFTAWQRNLNDNGRYAVNTVLEELRKNGYTTT